MKNTFFFLSVILLLASCGGSKKAKSSSTGLFLTGTKWTVLKIQDVMSTGSMNSRTLELTLPDKKAPVLFRAMEVAISSMADIQVKKVLRKYNLQI